MSGLDGALALDLEVAAIRNDWAIHGVVLDRMDANGISGTLMIWRTVDAAGRRPMLPNWGVVRFHHRGQNERAGEAVVFHSGRYDLARTAALDEFRRRSH